MTGTAAAFPRLRPVADRAVLVEFADAIGAAAHRQVRELDAALAARPFAGFTEAVPAYVSLLVCFDPLRTGHGEAAAALECLMRERVALPAPGAAREVLVCYDAGFAPDLAEIARVTGLSEEAVIAAHLGSSYSVYMYGFAPGYAYLAGVPETIQLPRKPSAARGIAAGSVLMAGPQCLVTTLEMPTGWWIIGRSPTRILGPGGERSFLFDIGDTVTFRRIGRDAFDAEAGRA